MPRKKEPPPQSLMGVPKISQVGEPYVHRNQLFTNANQMPIKRKPPLTSPAPKVSEGKVWGSRMMQWNWISYPVIHWYFNRSEPKNHHYSTNFLQKRESKLWITSLNSHFAGIYFGTIYMALSTWRKENPHRGRIIDEGIRKGLGGFILCQ